LQYFSSAKILNSSAKNYHSRAQNLRAQLRHKSSLRPRFDLKRMLLAVLRA